jgi:hypothetical protein
MKTSLKSLTMAIPLMFASFGGYAVAADDTLVQKLVSCGSNAKKILSVPNSQKVEIFQVIMSSSRETTVNVNLGGSRILRNFMGANTSFQASLLGTEGGAGENIRVSCTGLGDLSVTFVYNLSSAP